MIITEKMIADAFRYQEQVLSNWNEDIDYTGEQAIDRWAKGYIGEQVFIAWLEDFGIEYRYDVKADGMPDTGDIFVRNLVIDVKATIAKEPEFRVYKKQFDRHANIDIYVIVKIDYKYTKSAYIVGWCYRNRERILDYPNLNYYYMPTSWLYSAEELLKILRLEKTSYGN